MEQFDQDFKHEITNFLFGASTNLQIAKRHMNKNTKEFSYLEKALEGISNAQKMINKHTQNNID